MPVLCRPAVHFPEHVVTMAETLAMTRRLHADHPQLSLALRLIRNTGVARRHIVQPLGETLRHPGFEARNLVHSTQARARVPQVVTEALGHAELRADQIDALVYVSCTGFSMPSPTAWMINELGFRTDVRQLPIAQLGCAGGAPAVNLARDLCIAHPGANVLIVSCEFCSLLYQPYDLEVGSLLADGLFGDAVAAAVVRGAGGVGMELERVASRLVPHTEDWISYAVKSTGFHVRLDRRVPETMRDLAPVLDAEAREHGWNVATLDFSVIHAGGPRILDDLSYHLGVKPHLFDNSRATLTEAGNVASAVVLDALRRLFETNTPHHGARGLIAGFGPGITAEVTLGTWSAGTGPENKPQSPVPKEAP